MIDFTPPMLALVALTYFLAGVVKGVAGLGLPTVAMAVLGGLVSPATAAALLIAPSLVTNVWQLLTGPSFGALIRRLWPMMLCVALGTLATSGALASDDAGSATVALGLALAAYAALGLSPWRPTVAPRMERWLSPVVGLVTGLVAGATGVFAIPGVPYLQAIGLEKDDLVQSLGLLFTVATVALGIGLTAGGAYDAGLLFASLLAVPPAMLGLWVGGRIRGRIDADTFRRWFLVCLLLLGLQLALRPLF